MKIFDLKLIIIVALTFVIYFIYKEILNLNTKINIIYNKLIKIESITNIDESYDLSNNNSFQKNIDNLEEEVKNYNNIHTKKKNNI